MFLSNCLNDLPLFIFDTARPVALAVVCACFRAGNHVRGKEDGAKQGDLVKWSSLLNRVFR